MLSIFKREMKSYFSTPVGYIYIAVFMAVNGFSFSMFTLNSADSINLGGYFSIILLSFTVLVPLLTMRSFSEERKTKTEQLLLTSPVSLFSMVMGKFLAAYTMIAATLIAGCVSFIALFEYGNPNGAVLVGYLLAILFIGAAFAAIGIFISALTENQIAAAVGTIAVLLILFAIAYLNDSIPYTWLRNVLSFISIYSRFSNFTYGVFDFGATLYYCSISFVFIFLTVRVFEARRWA